MVHFSNKGSLPIKPPGPGELFCKKKIIFDATGELF
jgi:hypothetical protein